MKIYLPWTCLILAVGGGIFAGWVDFNNDEPQAAVLVILVVTFLLGLILPRKGWLWAIIVTLCVPGVYLFLRSLGYQSVSPPSPSRNASLLALIAAFIGVYAGVLGRAMINSMITKS